MQTKMLLIYLDENDMWEQTPLYEAVVRRLRQLGIAGATVHAGLMGYGGRHKVHRKRLFGISDDRPVTISVIDSEEKIGNVIPEIRKLTGGTLMVRVIDGLEPHLANLALVPLVMLAPARRKEQRPGNRIFGPRDEGGHHVTLRACPRVG